MRGHIKSGGYKVFCLAVMVLVGSGLSKSKAIENADHNHIILLESMPVPVVLAHTNWFKKELGKLGYQANHNLSLEILAAEGDRQKAEGLLRAAIVTHRPDVIVTNATLASQVAKEVIGDRRIPMVFMTVSDPVGAGLIGAVGQATGTHITGRVHMIDRRTRIQMALRLLGKPPHHRPWRIGFIHSSYPSAQGDIGQLKAAAKDLPGIEFISAQVAYRKVPKGLPQMLKEVKTAVAGLESQVDGWWEPSGPLGEVAEYTHIFITESAKPIVLGTKAKSVELGALMHLTPSIEASGREAARLAAAIIEGADPGQLAPTAPAAFDIGFNLSTALKHQIVIPPELLSLAKGQIFR